MGRRDCIVSQQVSSTLYLLLPYIIIIGIFYFILIRPQQKREKDTQKMRKSIGEGDEIITIGGLYGKIINIKDDMITIEVGSDKVKMKVARWAIGKIVNKKEAKAEPKAEVKAEAKTENKEEK